MAGWRLLVLLFLALTLLVPRPGRSPRRAGAFAIFICVIAGQMLHPLPGAAIVIIGLAAAVANGTPMREVLGGFAEPSVWLVLAAMVMARAILDRRCAPHRAALRPALRQQLARHLLCPRDERHHARGRCAVDHGAVGRDGDAGGRSIAELFGSRPGPDRAAPRRHPVRGDVPGLPVACAMFLTGQASNVLGAGLAPKLANVEVTWTSWLVAAIVPGLVSAWSFPGSPTGRCRRRSRARPKRRRLRARSSNEMGRVGRHEAIALSVFAGLGLLWATTGWHGLDVTFVALLGLVTAAADGNAHLGQRIARTLGVGRLHLVRRPAEDGRAAERHRRDQAVRGERRRAARRPAVDDGPAARALIYFYAHYFFASITAHMLAMFPPFVALLIGVGVPPLLAVYSLMCLANLTAGLTHYGTTTGPVLFSQGYVTFGDWWRVGFIVGSSTWRSGSPSASRGGGSGLLVAGPAGMDGR